MKKKFGKKKKLSEEMSLQITSMADIFTILLVFLLKSSATSMTTITPDDGMKLPVATVQSPDQIKDVLKLEITMDSILIDNKKVMSLKNWAPETGALPDFGFSGPVYKVLYEQRKHQPMPNMDSQLVMLADERTPYSTIKSVLASAASAGFVDLQMVMVKAE